jgi:putative phosphoesterase
MRIAVLSDIHGNSAALAATFRDISQLEPDEVIFLGDFVGYYYDAQGVLDLLDAFWPTWHQTSIAGNHEGLLGVARHSEEARKAYRRKYSSAVDIALETLSETDIARLAALPSTRELRLGGHVLSLNHGTPFDPTAYLYPDAAPDRLRACEVTDVDWVLMGHTHYPLVHIGQVSKLLNPGSVGQARDFGGCAAWAILDLETQEVDLRRSPYPVDKLQAAVNARDPDRPYLSAVLTRTTDTIEEIN